MRDLDWSELKYVSGAGDSPTPPGGCTCTCPTPTTKSKNNNGYGNGAESGPAPGNSGGHAAGADINFGPRGAR